MEDPTAVAQAIAKASEHFTAAEAKRRALQVERAPLTRTALA